MKKISQLTKNIRSKNAGPFWVTVDFFLKIRRILHTLVKIYLMKKYLKFYTSSQIS